MNISAVNAAPAVQSGQIYKEQASEDGFKTALEAAVRQNDDTQLRKACEGFESYFIQSMFREMRKTSLSTGGIFEKSNAEKIFEDMLYEEYSKTAAAKGGVGLADMMYRQLSKRTEN